MSNGGEWPSLCVDARLISVLLLAPTWARSGRRHSSEREEEVRVARRAALSSEKAPDADPPPFFVAERGG